MLHFGTREIQQQMADYCIPTVIREVNNLGGFEEGRLVPRKIDPRLPPGSRQLTLMNGR